MTLPTQLSLRDDNSLKIQPVDELTSLRGDHATSQDVELSSGEEVMLDSVRGNTIEIAITLQPGTAHEIGLNVLRSPDNQEATRISFFPKGHPRFGSAMLQIDGVNSSVREDLIPRPAEVAPLDVGDDDPIELRIFIDRSIVEVFANERQCLTLRAYPDRDDSIGVSLFARGGSAKFSDIEAWQMESVWPELG